MPSTIAPRVVYRGGRPYITDGTRFVPAARGGDGPVTVADLEIERAHVLDEIDDLVNTALSESRGLTDEEQTQHDAAVTRSDALEVQIGEIRRGEAVASLGAQQEIRRSWSAPNVNVVAPLGSGDRPSLDECLWATGDLVRAGSVTPRGLFNPNPWGAVNPVEQVVIRSDMGDQGILAPRIDSFTPDTRGIVRSFQQTVADMIVFGLIVEKSPARNSAEAFELARSHRLFADRWQTVLRAMDVDTTAEGANWVPTGIGATMHEKVRAMGKIAPLFARIDIPTNPWKWPLEGADAVAYRVAEPTGDTESKMTASTPGTGAATFDAEIFGARSLFSRTIDADSAVAILPYANNKLAKAFVIAEERAILDGDTDGTHQDSTVGASTTDARTAWDGLRKKGIAQTAVTATSTSVANLLALRKGMGKWGIDPSDLVYFVGVSAMHALLADTNVLTVDKFGPNATILNGQIASVAGVPVVASEYVREDLNASGVEDGITATKTYNLCVNRNEWAMGQRMALDLEVDDSIYRETFQRVVVGFMREDFQHIGDAATNEDTAITFNVTP